MAIMTLRVSIHGHLLLQLSEIPGSREAQLGIILWTKRSSIRLRLPILCRLLLFRRMKSSNGRVELRSWLQLRLTIFRDLYGRPGQRRRQWISVKISMNTREWSWREIQDGARLLSILHYLQEVRVRA